MSKHFVIGFALVSIGLSFLFPNLFAQENKPVDFDCGMVVGKNKMQWVKVQYPKSLKLPKKYKASILPLKYDVYLIDAEDLKAYLNAIEEKESQIVMPVPGSECVAFHTTKSNVMAEALRAKFPDIVSLKGYGVINGNNALRLDYDGNQLKAEITRNGEVFLMIPWKSKKRLYYILYNKKDSGVKKQPFE